MRKKQSPKSVPASVDGERTLVCPEPADVWLGQIIRRRRLTVGMSLEELGKQLGLSWQQVQRYETAKNRVSFSRLVSIAAVIDCPAVDLVRDAEEALRSLRLDR